MATKTELEQENARLRRELEAARTGQISRPVPGPPSFEICEGVAADLEMHGQALDPFTGQLIKAEDDEEIPDNEQ
jgi:hypothetical protein